MTRAATTGLAPKLRVSIARLARRLRQEGSPGDATPSQLAALALIYRSAPMTLGELAAAERVKPPSMTRIVGALEERGLVTREQSPEDGRVVRVQITDAGRRAHEEYQKRRDAWLDKQLAGFNADERKLLDQAAKLLDRLVER
jgi:DNA-binding MarR family transcriptional regulator